MIPEKKLSDERLEEDMDDLQKYKTPFSLNQSNELFDDDEADKKHKIIHVRRVRLPKNGENWEVCEDERRMLLIRGVKLTKREKSVLRTAEGINLLIGEYKNGNKSVTKIKGVLRECWKKNND